MASRVRLLGAASALVAMAVVLAGPAIAAFPEKPITLLVPTGAGSGMDILARLITNSIEKKSGWKFVVVNRTGGFGAIMAKDLKAKDPDGYTIGISASAFLAADPVYRENLGYDFDDFSYLGTIAYTQMAVIALKSKGWETLDDAMRAAKAQGGTITWGTPSLELQHAANLVGKKYGVQVKAVPFQGGGEVITDVLGGHIELGFGAGLQAQYVDAGKLVILASGQGDRLRQAPDRKTLIELGVPIDAGSYVLFAGPKGMPTDKVEILSDAIREALDDPEVQTLIDERMRFASQFNGPEATRKIVQNKHENAQQVSEELK